MKKIFLLVSFLVISSNAEYLLQYGSSEYCIDSYSISDGDPYIDIVLSSNKRKYTLNIDIDQIIPGYVYDPNKKTCNLAEELQKTGLDYYQFNFLYAILGVFIGSFFLGSLLFRK